MHVSIKYIDTDSFTKEEVVRTAMDNYGRNIQIKVMPDSTNPHDMIYFALQQMITHQQLSLVFDKSMDYQVEIKKLRAEALYKLEEVLDTVIVDNEDKVQADNTSKAL